MADDKPARITVDLSGQTALVTGASRGIGRAVALALGRSGARVACAARNVDKLGETVAAITAAGGTAQAFACDVNDGVSVDKLVETVAAQWERIDILVNNAGITRDTLLLRMDDSQWDDVIQTNLRGTFLFTRAVAKVMLSQKYGRIINITSVVGFKGNAGQANYSASKAGVIGFTRTVARELGKRKITVNAVAPGFIQTDMTEVLPPEIKEELKKQIPAARLGTAEDVAEPVLFLASPAAAYVTGHVLTVDGGMTA
jgi:3-oxoacyl-[acyl-carrier protein] reductase